MNFNYDTINRNITCHVFTNYLMHKMLKTADFQSYKYACYKWNK